jgi:NADPH:quinone reductase-like Zn-dependent oxidoreductase
LEDGTLKPAIARILPFEDIADAHRFLERGKQIGKVVVTL